MRLKGGLRLAALVALSFMAALHPSRAFADAQSIKTMCDDGQFDKDINNANSDWMRQLMTGAHNINTMFPIEPALNQCVQNLMQTFSKFPSLADPMNIASSLINPIIDNVISSTCSQVMGTVTSAQTALTNLTKICIPMPSFNINLDLPTYNATACSGGTQISPISGWSSPQISSPTFNQYQSQ
ncbi:MAG: hypothetical protein P4M15_13685 [Alphaproteobacteria bacterium]|nr:hypothetical protein [Alphaproteobacteria bacterium]